MQTRYRRLSISLLAGVISILAISGLVAPLRAELGTHAVVESITPMPTPNQVFLPLALNSHDRQSIVQPTPEPTSEPMEPQQLPAACYATDATNARDECVLALSTAYVVTMTFNSDIFLAFPITKTLHVSVTDYSAASGDVDLVLWGENSQGKNVQGPFHPGPTGGPHGATWTPSAPYVTPGIHLVEMFSATGYPFTVQLTVENLQ